jgi:regulatory protein
VSEAGRGLEPIYVAAGRLLTARRRSVAELRSRLLDQGHPAEGVAQVLARLQAAGLLDDAALAAAYVHDGSRLKGHGRFRLRRELAAAGLAPELIDSVLDRDYPPEDEAAVALELARRRAPRLAGLPPEVARRRLAGFLERRGLAAGAVWAALDAVLPRGRAPEEES